MTEGLAAAGTERKPVLMGANYLKTHCTVSSPAGLFSDIALAVTAIFWL
ncbi:MAG: hypothetical protein P0Y64_12685 [Candidatus Sphingomonas colombiensis]|nr:hypothetical protein [Sphingomonas sp.]WEK42248.1 MAG: hypothetical protein P0Y64_12685 [Sphingomonas sp.]